MNNVLVLSRSIGLLSLSLSNTTGRGLLLLVMKVTIFDSKTHLAYKVILSTIGVSKSKSVQTVSSSVHVCQLIRL